MKCENCSIDASYEYYVSSGFKQLFCGRHLPAFLKSPRYSGRVLKIVPAVAEPVAEGAVVETKKKKSSKAVAEPVVEDAVVEEPVVEDAPTKLVDEPTEVVEGQ